MTTQPNRRLHGNAAHCLNESSDSFVRFAHWSAHAVGVVSLRTASYCQQTPTNGRPAYGSRVVPKAANVAHRPSSGPLIPPPSEGCMHRPAQVAPSFAGTNSVASPLTARTMTLGVDAQWLSCKRGQSAMNNAASYGPARDGTMPSSPKIRPNALNSSRCRSIAKITRSKKRVSATKTRIGDADVSAELPCADFRLLAVR
jgi:hypothetical protein